MEKDWLQYEAIENDNYSLLDYAEDALKQLINEKKAKKQDNVVEIFINVFS